MNNKWSSDDTGYRDAYNVGYSDGYNDGDSDGYNDGYNQAIKDFVKKCENAKFYQFGQHYVDIREIREFKKELKI